MCVVSANNTLFFCTSIYFSYLCMLKDIFGKHRTMLYKDYPYSPYPINRDL